MTALFLDTVMQDVGNGDVRVKSRLDGSSKVVSGKDDSSGIVWVMETRGVVN